MSIAAYEKIIADNKNLNLLINEKSVGGLASFKKTDDMTPEFVDWVSPKYLEVFEAIYRKNVNQNEGVICSILRAIFLANEETKAKIVEICLPHIDASIENAEFVLTETRKKPKLIIEHANSIANDFSYLNRALFNTIDHPTMVERRVKFIQTYMEVCEELKGFKPRRDPIEHGIYAGIIEKIGELDIDKSDSGLALQKHQTNASTKQTLYVIGTVVLLIIVILRWVWRLSR